jgi:FKBP-type peptidyl-prolyl cis-trans isomerase
MLNKVPIEKEFSSDTTIYINYTGRLLDLEIYDNGLMFDTNIENVAKENYIFDNSRTYEPAAIKWAETHGEITMDGSSLVSGFTQTLWNMANCGPGTKAVGVFYSDLGYGYSGSGSIPAYAPLVFEIEIVDKPE